MDYNSLLELATTVAHRLAMSGAETFRVEDTVLLIMQAYGVEAEAFAIPNCLTVSIETPDGIPMTRMKRIGYHDNDLDCVERYSNLSRRICREKPDPKVALQWLKEADQVKRKFPLPVHLAGSFLGACGYSIFFGGSFADSLFAGICGIVVGLVNMLMDRLKANAFFRTIIASFLMAVLAYGLSVLGIVNNADTVIIGTLMILVPGLLFTNALRDIIYGDTNSGLNRIVMVFMIAVAIALGTGAALQVISSTIAAPPSVDDIVHTAAIQLLACLVGCIGFSILFNIHGPGILLCALGGALAWASYMIAVSLGGSDLFGYLCAAICASVYSETMARIRKYPAISYLVVSIFPLIPGASVYYTMTHAVKGDMASFADMGMHTIGIAGAIAVGILLVSTAFRIWTMQMRNRKKA